MTHAATDNELSITTAPPISNAKLMDQFVEEFSKLKKMPDDVKYADWAEQVDIVSAFKRAILERMQEPE